ncbi:MAG: hypothetical protein ABR61_03900 [Actinobacteria bacterium BACL2 MAG-120813-bin23]|uniref:ER-bound oxygenase mpaB/mpaB'/Rubber oxygenase catalytic domain-containing protein n=1 Tax=Actinobacteria bacterium BACL2 MAG-120813-bin23 TaxID=1655569 RepID=A0A0R2QAQ1_9ACTN|nr:MAG: hypothetical protein ABR61_03900 [Actinobacteria bacterium BACL2 MAG-120813-bin23]
MSLGFFSPDSITWRVHSDPSMFVGGIRALLQQALHPEAMAGVAAHSNFREDAGEGLRGLEIMLQLLPLLARKRLRS